MSNLSDIIGGCQTVLQNNITELHGYTYPPDSINDFPAAVILLDPIEPQMQFGGNTFEGDLRVILLLSVGADPAEGFAQLYDYIDPTTANKSVIKAIRADKTLNGKVDDADVTRIENIGRRSIGGGEYYGFDAIIHYIKSVA